MEKIFSSIIPAPNPTGNLHVGHLLNLCLQDIFCRWKKHKSYDVYWLAGVDHGATSTQYVVTQEILKNEGKMCSDEKLKLKINEWIDKYSDIIFNEFSEFNLCIDDKNRVAMHSELFQKFSDQFISYLETNNHIYSDFFTVPWSYRLQSSTDLIDYAEHDNQVKAYSCHFADALTDAPINIVSNNLSEILNAQGIVYSEGDIFHEMLEEFNNFIGSKSFSILKSSKNSSIVGPCFFSPASNKQHYEFAIENGIEIASNLTDDGTVIRGDLSGLNLLNDEIDIENKLKESRVLKCIIVKKQAVKRYRVTDEPLQYHYTKQKVLAVHKLAEKARQKIDFKEVFIKPDIMKNLVIALIERADGRHPKIVDAEWSVERGLLCGTTMPGRDFSKDGDLKPSTLDMKISCALWSYYAHHYYTQFGLDYNVLAQNSICVTGSDLVPFWIYPIILLSTTGFLALPFSTVISHPLVCDQDGQKMSKSKGNVISPKEIINAHGIEVTRIYLFMKLPDDEYNLILNKDEIEKTLINLKNLDRVLKDNDCLNFDPEISTKINLVLNDTEQSLEKYSTSKLGESLRQLFKIINDLKEGENLSADSCKRIRHIMGILTGNSSNYLTPINQNKDSSATNA